MRKCTMCHTKKALSEFWKLSGDRGLRSWCIGCCKLWKAQHKSPSDTPGTLSRFKTATWARINGRTVNGSCPQTRSLSAAAYIRKGVRLEMTKADFFSWCDRNAAAFYELVTRGETPSIDRRESRGHYAVDNLRLLSWRENGRLGGVANGRRLRKPIVATDGPGAIIHRFPSAKEAQRNGFNQGAICNCARGGKHSYKGLFWKFEGNAP